MITANSNASTVSVLLGNGNGSFRNAVDYPVGAAPVSIAAADMDRDGKPDIIVANNAADTVSILFGRGNGTLQDRIDYPTGPNPNFVAIADANRDGRPDVMVAHAGAPTGSVRTSRPACHSVLDRGRAELSPTSARMRGTARRTLSGPLHA